MLSEFEIETMRRRCSLALGSLSLVNKELTEIQKALTDEQDCDNVSSMKEKERKRLSDAKVCATSERTEQEGSQSSAPF